MTLPTRQCRFLITVRARRSGIPFTRGTTQRFACGFGLGCG
jgi:hypothetical protein